MTYTMRQGETIRDVCLNATGTITNWPLILEANGFTDWVPNLMPGQILIIPDTVQIQSNIFQQMAVYPANNNVNIPDFTEMVDAFIASFTPVWILATGYWNDLGYWVDNAYWND